MEDLANSTRQNCARSIYGRMPQTVMVTMASHYHLLVLQVVQQFFLIISSSRMQQWMRKGGAFGGNKLCWFMINQQTHVETPKAPSLMRPWHTTLQNSVTGFLQETSPRDLADSSRCMFLHNCCTQMLWSTLFLFVLQQP